MGFSTRTIQGPVGRLAVTTAGEGGLPVLFVHGNSGNRTQWAAQQAHLAQRSVSFDLRGMGESDPDPAGRYHFRDFTEDVGAVADALGLERFVLVGHSFGCAVAAEYAAHHPGRVAGLVLGDPGGSMRDLPPEVLGAFREGFLPEKYGAARMEWFEPMLRGARPGTRQAVLGSLYATPREVMATATWSLLDCEPEEQLSRYPGPCLSISAEATLAQLGAKALHLRVPGMRVEVLPAVSHWLMMDAPESFNATLDEFLADVEARLELEDSLPPGPTDASGALTMS
ncbi:alpha/beta hydrolase [Archangium sp.]|uniref:alpha/beta fold hydrolase n=1 Tax=Archangium sp. TaxID=1872627 RepID=UPI002D705EC7|nr:alpha/beta hydrolase [Archangium sp.]HYO57818.1 alpha/beta hydrolase [Archangium sp.]